MKIMDIARHHAEAGRTGVVKILVMVAFLTTMSSAQATSATDMVVVRPVVNMFRTASMDADVVSQALYGANVAALKSEGDWVEIRTADNYTGWTPSSGVRATSGKKYAVGAGSVRVVEFSANVYREPDVTAHAPLLNLPWESRLEVIDPNYQGHNR